MPGLLQVRSLGALLGFSSWLHWPIASSKETRANRQNEDLTFGTDRQPNCSPREARLAHHHADFRRAELGSGKTLFNGLQRASQQRSSGEENEGSRAKACEHANGDERLTRAK